MSSPFPIRNRVNKTLEPRHSYPFHLLPFTCHACPLHSREHAWTIIIPPESSFSSRSLWSEMTTSCHLGAQTEPKEDETWTIRYCIVVSVFPLRLVRVSRWPTRPWTRHSDLEEFQQRGNSKACTISRSYRSHYTGHNQANDLIGTKNRPDFWVFTSRIFSWSPPA